MSTKDHPTEAVMARYTVTYKELSGQEIRGIFDYKGDDQSEAEVKNAFLNKRQGIAEVLSVVPWGKKSKNEMQGKSDVKIAATTARETPTPATPVVPPVEKVPSLEIRGFKFYFDATDKRSTYWKPCMAFIAEKGMSKEELLQIIRAARLALKGEEWCIKQVELGWTNFLNPNIHTGYVVVPSETGGVVRMHYNKPEPVVTPSVAQ